MDRSLDEIIGEDASVSIQATPIGFKSDQETNMPLLIAA